MTQIYLDKLAILEYINKNSNNFRTYEKSANYQSNCRNFFCNVDYMNYN